MQAEKPWFFECEHPLKQLWRNYYKSIFSHKPKLKFKYTGKRCLNFIKRKVLSIIFKFPMNANYEVFPPALEKQLYTKLGLEYK